MHVVDAEEVILAERQRPALHFVDRHPPGVRSRNQGPNAGPRDQRRPDAALFERPNHTDVGEPFQATATEDEGNARREERSRQG